MRRKIFSIIGVVLLILAVQGCSSHPEKNLLERYFHAISLNDAQTMATMSLQPLKIEADSWEIIQVSEESVNEASLPDLNKVELDLKKQKDESIGFTLDASDELDDAKFELENARTRNAKRAARKKIDELQIKYDEIYEKHKNIQKQYNEAKAAAQKEEDISLFSLNPGDELPNIRDFLGDMTAKEVDIECVMKDGTEKNYRVFMRKYVLKNEAAGYTHRGRWIITKFEVLK
ncbi:MAG: hypothetical protein KAX11_05360 [Candidatus Aminicenantes bacterium]|nr:hypothetical protein [Candidatus Aminicenantes bacterium]